MPKHHREMERFKAEFLESVRDMKAGRAARVTRVDLSPAARARASTGLTQTQFAQLLGVSVKTLRNWEQGRTQPSGAASTLIKVAMTAPQVLKAVMA